MVSYNTKIISYENGACQIRYFNKQVGVSEKKKQKHDSGYIDTPWETKARLVKEFDDTNARHSKSRAKRKVYEYARSNKWEYFVTWTFSPKDTDRYNYAECSKKIRKWLNNTKNRYAKEIKYLVVPEQHKDGAWHFHGLVSDVGELPFKEHKNGIYNIGTYSWGFTTATKIKDTQKASSYLAKYISKSNATEIEPGKQRYFVSNNLKEPNTVILNIENLEELKKMVQAMKKEITYSKHLDNAYISVDYLELSTQISISEIKKYINTINSAE